MGQVFLFWKIYNKIIAIKDKPNGGTSDET